MFSEKDFERLCLPPTRSLKLETYQNAYNLKA